VFAKEAIAMRLSADKIKTAILDPDSALRTAAVYYFAGGSSPDPSLMPLVIQAFEKYGIDAFDFYSFLDSLAQTDESISWICRQLDQIDPEADETADDLFGELVEALRTAEAMLLERHAAEIREVRQLDEGSKAAISNRIQLASLASEALWQKLIELCQSQDLETGAEDDFDFDFGCSIVDALAKYPDQSAGEVLKILAREEGGDWLEVMAARLAGAIRLEAATPTLVGFLADPDSWDGASARWALSRIGSDAVVEELAARYGDEDLRSEIACLFKNIHTDLCVQTCVELLGQEQDEELREWLIISLLMNFATEGIEPARQFVLMREKSPEVLEVRDVLLLACRMLDARFPEFDAWLEDSQHDVEFLQAWYEEHGYGDFIDDFDDEEGFEDDDDLDAELDDDFIDQPAETVVRKDEKIGRNDPCPCGSGKKYKKCCLHKQVLG
jgi:hypothetical protein